MYIHIIIYETLAHEGNLKAITYLLGSGKLIGSPLTVFIITRAVYKHLYLNTQF